MDSVEVSLGSIADVPALEPLWVAVHHVHQDSMPELAPYVSDSETWRERRALYERLLDSPGSFLLLARQADAVIGYALGYTVDPSADWASDTWTLTGRIGELESLAVAPTHRNHGVGSALLDAVDRQFESLGIENVVLGVLPGNTDAMRLYERRGFRPTWLYLSRFAGR